MNQSASMFRKSKSYRERNSISKLTIGRASTVMIATLVLWCAAASASESDQTMDIQRAEALESLVEIEVESSRLGLVSKSALEGDRVAFVDLAFASKAIDRASAKLDARALNGQPLWTTQSNWSSLRKEIQTVIDAEDLTLRQSSAAFQLKLKIDSLKFSFLTIAMKPGVISDDATRVFYLMDSALNLQSLAASIPVLISNTRDSGLVKITMPRQMESVETNTAALLDGNKELEMFAETNPATREKLSEIQSEMRSTFSRTRSFIESMQALSEASRASPRIAKDAAHMAALARSYRGADAK